MTFLLPEVSNYYGSIYVNSLGIQMIQMMVLDLLFIVIYFKNEVYEYIGAVSTSEYYFLNIIYYWLCVREFGYIFYMD